MRSCFIQAILLFYAVNLPTGIRRIPCLVFDRQFIMTTVNDVDLFLNELAPRELAEDWDNVGLLVGDAASPVKRLMTCLTVTPQTAGEAIARNVDMIVTHHPMPFRPVQRLTTDHTAGRLLMDLIKAEVAIFSPHTAFDSTAGGINQLLAESFNTTNVRPLVPANPDNPAVGAARVGDVSTRTTMAQLIEQAKGVFNLAAVQYVGERKHVVKQIGFACGSGGSFLDQAIAAGCDTFVTGETNFHTCLEASARGIGLLLLGHFASERFAVDALAEELQRAFEGIEVWASRQEVDPLNIG